MGSSVGGIINILVSLQVEDSIIKSDWIEEAYPRGPAARA